MADQNPLISCLMDIERHVSTVGWDQPARLFALVTTARLLEVEPQLAGRIPEAHLDSLTAIEQDNFHIGDDLGERLASISWPDNVEGCALAMERFFLREEHQPAATMPADEVEAYVANHPERVDVRVVVGVLRDGTKHGLGRFVSNPDDLLGAEDLVPGLGEALLATFRSVNDE